MLDHRCYAPVEDPSFFVLVGAEIEMERDDDYLRQLLQEFEAGDTWVHVSTVTLGASAERLKRHFHVLLLVDAGLMAPFDPKQGGVYRITNSGHDFLALTRDKGAWDAVKGALRHMRGASVQMLLRVAEGYAMAKLREMGVPLE